MGASCPVRRRSGPNLLVVPRRRHSDALGCHGECDESRLTNGGELTSEKIAALYRSLYRIRRTEEEIARIYPSDKIQSPVHLSVGQEAVSVAVCEALRLEDVVFGTYRG